MSLASSHQNWLGCLLVIICTLHLRWSRRLEPLLLLACGLLAHSWNQGYSCWSEIVLTFKVLYDATCFQVFYWGSINDQLPRQYPSRFLEIEVFCLETCHTIIWLGQSLAKRMKRNPQPGLQKKAGKPRCLPVCVIVESSGFINAFLWLVNVCDYLEKGTFFRFLVFGAWLFGEIW